MFGYVPFTDIDTLLRQLRHTLPGTEYTELRCPLCSAVWKEHCLVERCHMSDDERIFLFRILEVNRKTRSLLYGTMRKSRELSSKM